jgi:hypothetical protein
MSHVVKLAIQVKDLDALGAAAEQLGCELVRDAKTHLYYSGKRAKCSHAIRVKNNAQAYEIGLVPGENGTWELQADFYNGGRGLATAVGHNAVKLKQEYAVQVAIRHAQRHNRRVHREQRADGSVVLRMA